MDFSRTYSQDQDHISLNSTSCWPYDSVFSFMIMEEQRSSLENMSVFKELTASDEHSFLDTPGESRKIIVFLN